MFAWGLPAPPSPEAFARTTPAIAPVPPGSPRPRWSVTIPTFNCADLLARTLESVLVQDAGPDAMEIVVVDDCSTRDDPAAVAASVGRGRVDFRPNGRNLGPTATFNACIGHARGHWVHLLHGDDMVLPGFYAECDRIIAAHPDVVMIVGQVVTIDPEDRWTAVIGPAPSHAGTRVENFLTQQATQQLAQFSGVAVRRDAYERAGGFSSLFGHVADRDMWFRIGQLGPVWCTSRPYGLYRVHPAADTGKHVRQATNVEETYLSTRLNLARLGLAADGPEASAFRRWLAHRAYRSARKLAGGGDLEGAKNQLRWSLRLNTNARNLTLAARVWLRALAA
jgi:GT2 family glycosyltransferase